MALRKADEGQGAGQGAGRIKNKYRYISKDNPLVKTSKVSKDKQRRVGDALGLDPDPQDAPHSRQSCVIY